MESDKFIKRIATLGPLGYRVGSGTLGSLVGLLLVWVSTYWFSPFMQAGIVLVAIGSSFVIVALAARHFTSQDPKEIILDEVVGCLVAFYGIPLTFSSALIGFSLFRFFDISKTCGVGYIERTCKGSWGIVLDDLFAACLANVCTRLLLSTTMS
jgi:phosphatidylglycerophosphatase A